MAVIAKILLLCLLGHVYPDPVPEPEPDPEIIIQVKQSVDLNNCPCDGCCENPAPAPAPVSTAPTTAAVTSDGCEKTIGTKYIFFTNCKRTFAQANTTCQDYGWSLASPNDDFDDFLDAMPSVPDGEYWVDVESEINPADPSGPYLWYWMTSPEELTADDQWADGFAPEVYTHECGGVLKDDGLFNLDCNEEWYFACESN